jgi:hypothetical protein
MSLILMLRFVARKKSFMMESRDKFYALKKHPEVLFF